MRTPWIVAALLVCLQACVSNVSDERSGPSPDTASTTGAVLSGGDGDPDVPCVENPATGACATGTSIGVASGTCTSTEIFNSHANGGIAYWTCQNNTRYLCDDHNHKIVETCPNGCTSHPVGSDDECAFGSAVTCTSTEFTAQDLVVNGFNASFWTCQGKARYVCDSASSHFKVKESCPNSCVGEGAGHDDQCQ